jgi:aspartyl-tRNA(Asn)/glutamyl-tRNA(Gln) amidotransferase subunit A
MDDYAYLTIAEASALIRAKKISPVEYTQALLARIEKLDPGLNAFLRQTPDIALADARRTEQEIVKGNWRGPLHGVPYGLKDIIDYEGLPTTGHSKILKDNIAKADAPVAAKLRAAGGVFMGKLSTHEFAIGGPSFDLPWPPARNPWNADHHPGGSSSGSGCALAAGLFAAALGSDTGGSIRNPASCCGITGLKPTYGRTSRRGVLPLSFSLDHVGPMTRTVEDNAILLNLIAGHDAGDPGSADVPTENYTAALGKSVKGLKIGVIRHFYARDEKADPEMTKSIEDALDLFKSDGAEIREIEVDPLLVYAACNRIILTSEAYAIHEKWLKERPQDYGARARGRLLAGAFLTAADYINATRLRRKLVDRFHAAIAGVDVVVTVSSMEPACRIDDDGMIERTYGRQARAPFNLTGSPAMSIPTGYSSSGMPLSMQIVGKPFQEAMIYRVAHAYERATEWTKRRPVLGERKAA